MDNSALLEAFILTGQKIDVLWNFYVSVHLAIAGALFYFHTLSKKQYFIFGIGYAFFTVINWRAKTHEYNLYNALVTELKLRDLDSEHISAFFEMFTASDRSLINSIVHVVSALCLLALILFEVDNSNEKIDT